MRLIVVLIEAMIPAGGGLLVILISFLMPQPTSDLDEKAGRVRNMRMVGVLLLVVAAGIVILNLVSSPANPKP